MEIIACPNCGSRRIYQGTMGEGVLTGYTSRNVCRDCGYQGMPLIFDSEKEYKEFLKSKSIDIKKIEIKKNDKKNKKTIKRPIGVSILVFLLILEAIITTYLYYNIIGIENTTLLGLYYYAIFLISAIILPYGLLKGREWAWMFGGILFAMSIPIGLIYFYYITRPHVKAFFGKD